MPPPPSLAGAALIRHTRGKRSSSFFTKYPVNFQQTSHSCRNRNRYRLLFRGECISHNGLASCFDGSGEIHTELPTTGFPPPPWAVHAEMLEVIIAHKCCLGVSCSLLIRPPYPLVVLARISFLSRNILMPRFKSSMSVSHKLFIAIIFLLLTILDPARCELRLARRLEPHPIDKRNGFQGGWALQSSTCAAGEVSCSAFEACCPAGTSCDANSLGGDTACCPDRKYFLAPFHPPLLHNNCVAILSLI
jgi:hypothetical protein